jgi:hypothetical protein
VAAPLYRRSPSALRSPLTRGLASTRGLLCGAPARRGLASASRLLRDPLAGSLLCARLLGCGPLSRRLPCAGRLLCCSPLAGRLLCARRLLRGPLATSGLARAGRLASCRLTRSGLARCRLASRRLLGGSLARRSFLCRGSRRRFLRRHFASSATGTVPCRRSSLRNTVTLTAYMPEPTQFSCRRVAMQFRVACRRRTRRTRCARRARQQNVCRRVTPPICAHTICSRAKMTS